MIIFRYSLLFYIALFISLAAAANWGPFVGRWLLTCGQNVWTSQILNVNGDWEEACWNTPARPPGSTAGMSPYRCQNLGISGMWGHFNVSVPWGGCDFGSTDINNVPHWGTFRDDGCVFGGFRLWASRLWGIQGDWGEGCWSTKGRPSGENCVLPDICDDGGIISGMWGKFKIPDPTCNIALKK